LLFALLLTGSTASCGTTFATLLLASALGWLVIVLLVGVGILLALAALLALIVIIVILVVLIVAVLILLDDLEVVFECEGNQLVLELVGEVEILIHQFSGVLFGLLFVVFGFLLRGLALCELLLIGHLTGLEEVEETLLLYGLGNGLTWLTLLCLLLLLDLLLCDILAFFPFDLGAFALLDHVLILGHHEGLAELLVLEVVILFKGENQVETVAGVMKNALNVLQIHEDWAILLLDETSDASVVNHGAHPEAWDTSGTVLDVLNIASIDLELLVILIIKFLCAGLVCLEDV
jgi:hypothetical protein